MSSIKSIMVKLIILLSFVGAIVTALDVKLPVAVEDVEDEWMISNEKRVSTHSKPIGV